MHTAIDVRADGQCRAVELPWDEGPLLAPVEPRPSGRSAASRPSSAPDRRPLAPAQPAGWCDAALASLDLETTGRDPATDRILAIALYRQDAGGDPVPVVDTLVDPGRGVAIPDEAAAVHGITRDRLEATQAPPLRTVLVRLHAMLTDLADAGTAVVIYNAPFDWPFLAAELGRLDPPLALPPCELVDPLVLDRHVDRYRKGKRTLQAACEVYGVTLTDAHEAAADARASLGVARAIGRSYPEVGALTPRQLHTVQVDAHLAWRDDFNDYLRRIDAGRAPVTGRWPDRR